ncbi:unnamed protein product, partial [Mesorhabditis belari]|uniref:Major sperm protein n=1 Tax=Mesorhabditis belari TaxID=2138241 RepID=A0AAF3J4Q0_9BILA
MKPRPVERLFIVSPDQFVDFTTVLDGKLTAHYELYNISSGRMGFRIQSNASENYRVVPSSGFIESGARLVVTTTVRSGGNVDSRHCFRIHGLDVCDSELDLTIDEFWKYHPKIMKESYTLKVRAPEFRESRLRERLLTQVAAIRQTNSTLRKRIETLELNNNYLVGLTDVSEHHGHASRIIVHFAYSMLAILLTLFAWDLSMAIIFSDEYETILLEKGQKHLETAANFIEALREERNLTQENFVIK